MILYDSSNDFIRFMSLLTVREAARRLGVSYSTLKQWIYKGSVRTTKTDGGHHRLTELEIERLLHRHGDKPTEAHRVKRARGEASVAISGRNQLHGIVEEVRSDGLLSQIYLRVGDQVLTAVITRDAVAALKLKRGDTAVAIMKSTEVMIARETNI
jgi:molybdopterin-binding protein|tara:strand:- start:5338 stop:5805 length:468 start_codon:yes stop_codon:yes gene_type:complete